MKNYNETDLDYEKIHGNFQSVYDEGNFEEALSVLREHRGQLLPHLSREELVGMMDYVLDTRPKEAGRILEEALNEEFRDEARGIKVRSAEGGWD